MNTMDLYFQRKMCQISDIGMLFKLDDGVLAFFRSPLVSFVYERGWRQNFNRSGFPGPDEEVICYTSPV